MDPVQTLFASLCSLAFLICFSWLYLHRQKHITRLPPGPPAWPILGHLHMLGALPHRSLLRLAQRYGHLMYMRLGSVPTIVASSPELAKEFLKTHDQTFATRPQTAAGKYTVYNYSGIGWAPYGPYWRQARKICLTELFSPKRLESFRGIREEDISSLMRSILDLSLEGKAVDIQVKLSSLARNIMSRMVSNKSQTTGRRNLDDEEFKELIEEQFFLNGVFNIGDYIPYLKWLDLQGYERRMKKLSHRLDAFLQPILEDHRERRLESQVTEPRDFVDVLLSVAEDPGLELKLTDNQIKAIILEMFAAGTDTSAVTIEWALAELLKNPSALKAAQEELDSVVGEERHLEENDIPKLNYLQAIVKETLRLHPAGPLLVPHENMEACEINGYHIPAKTKLIVNVWAIGRDDRVWEEATKFDPNRFLGSSIDLRGQHFELIPFGSGRRGCPGMALALSVMHLTLARLLHCFNWSLPPPQNPHELDMSEKFGLTVPRAMPLVAIPTARLPRHSY